MKKLLCFRYHIKYMFVGDMLKVESETIIRRLRPALQMRLRFITHLNVDEIATEQSSTFVCKSEFGRHFITSLCIFLITVK